MPTKNESDIRKKITLLYIDGKITQEQYSRFDSDTSHYPTIPYGYTKMERGLSRI